MCRCRRLSSNSGKSVAIKRVVRALASQKGTSLTETLIALVLSSYIIAGVTGFYVAFKTSVVHEQSSSQMVSGLRIAMARVSEKLRNSAWGVPSSDLPSWVSWVSGITTNPTIIQGVSGRPDTLTVVESTMKPVTTLALTANIGDMAINVVDATELDDATHRLILLDGTEHVHIISGTGTTLLIDTDPVVSGQQGLSRSYPAGTPVYRLDVLSMAIDSGQKRLTLDFHDGAASKVLLDGISDMQIQELVSGSKYRVTLTAVSDTPNLETGNYDTRTINSDVTTRR